MRRTSEPDEAAIPNCKDMSEIVTDYLDRALPWHMRMKARLHLFLCVACRQYYQQMRRTVRFLATARSTAPTSEVEQQVLDSLAAPRQSKDG